MSGKLKRYTVYKYPSLYGTPKHFRFKWMAYLYSSSTFLATEILDNETGEYL